MSRENRKYGVTHQVKHRKRASKIKWKDIEYHVQDNAYIAHKELKMNYDTNQFSELPFCGPYPNPCGAMELSKHYRLRFDKKTRSCHMCNSPHTMCLCFMYINACPTLDFWYTIKK